MTHKNLIEQSNLAKEFLYHLTEKMEERKTNQSGFKGIEYDIHNDFLSFQHDT